MDKFVSQSKEWMSKSSIDYSLEVNENEQRLTFRADENVSFYINYADKEDGKLVGLGFHNQLNLRVSISKFYLSINLSI